MRYVVTGIEYEGVAHWGIGRAGPGDKCGLLIRRIPDNATQIHRSNIPDPNPTERLNNGSTEQSEASD